MSWKTTENANQLKSAQSTIGNLRDNNIGQLHQELVGWWAAKNKQEGFQSIISWQKMGCTDAFVPRREGSSSGGDINGAWNGPHIGKRRNQGICLPCPCNSKHWIAWDVDNSSRAVGENWQPSSAGSLCPLLPSLAWLGLERGSSQPTVGPWVLPEEREVSRRSSWSAPKARCWLH